MSEKKVTVRHCWGAGATQFAVEGAGLADQLASLGHWVRQNPDLIVDAIVINPALKPEWDEHLVVHVSNVGTGQKIDKIEYEIVEDGEEG
jgi:hypothetical protein